MDFMKAFDQTVRDIKREVNLRVLKVPEIEQKVLDATSDEPWGPHGSDLAELAKETKKFTECPLIMNALWTRLSESGANWRNVYKALAVIEYLVANGAENAVDDIIEHTFQISSLSNFEYIEPNGKDMGINVRRKVEMVLGLISDREKIKAVRDKAAATRDKYFGLSSSGITYKSSSASYSGSSGGYGGFSRSRMGEKLNDTCMYKDYSEEEFGSKHIDKDEELQANISVPYSEKNKLKKETTLHGSTSSKQGATSSVTTSSQRDDDDFDPRGSTAVMAPASANQVDLFRDNVVGDLLHLPTPVSPESTASKHGDRAEVDLFAEATFVSAPAHSDTHSISHLQENVDLFVSQTAATASLPTQTDIFDMANSVVATAPKPCNSDLTQTNSFDPFAAVPLNKFEESEIFGSFSSNTNLVNEESSKISANDCPPSLDQSSSETFTQPTKDTFQVKSGIWADSLSRGLIDLNISAPKKTSLADVGVLGGLGDSFDDKEKGPCTSSFMGRAMGPGTGLGKSGFPSTGAGSASSFSSIR